MVSSDTDTFVYDGYLNVGATVWDPTEPVATRPLVWLKDNDAVYYLHDGNKNVTDAVSYMGSARYSYSPFGQSEQDGVLARGNPYRFSSEIYDDVLALTCYNYRHYDFVKGRWVVRDGIFEIGGENIYVSFKNAPVCIADWLGNVCYDYGDPVVVESKVTTGKSSEVKVSVQVIDASPESGVVFPAFNAMGYMTIVKVRCKCTYRVTRKRQRTDKIMEHKQQMQICEYKYNCGTVSITQAIDLGWFNRTETKVDFIDRRTETSYARPWGADAGDCFTPCYFQMPTY